MQRRTSNPTSHQNEKATGSQGSPAGSILVGVGGKALHKPHISLHQGGPRLGRGAGMGVSVFFACHGGTFRNNLGRQGEIQCFIDATTGRGDFFWTASSNEVSLMRPALFPPFGFTIKRQGRLRLRKPAHRVEWAVNGAEAMFHLLTAPSSECSAHIVCGTHCGCPFVHARGPTGCHWLRLKHDNVDACSVARSSALGQGAPMGPPWGCP